MVQAANGDGMELLSASKAEEDKGKTYTENRDSSSGSYNMNRESVVSKEESGVSDPVARKEVQPTATSAAWFGTIAKMGAIPTHTGVTAGGLHNQRASRSPST